MAQKSIGLKVKAPENGGRRLVITDIHGCANTFDKLLNKVGLNQNDQLFLLGDYINRGPRSKQVIDQILQLKEDDFNVFCLMGNHEETLLHLLFESPEELRMLLKSRKSLNLLNKRGFVRKRFVQFFRELAYYIKLEDHFLVHAGFNMKIDKPLTDVHAMCWTRNFQIEKPYKGRQILFGHTPTKLSKIRLQLEQESPYVCLDNGCSHTYLGKEYGRLLCYDIDSRELFKQKNIDQ
ncbi:MAG: serine/threonine protein phosphatase [Flavobacteriales bacterium]|nr:serine/threonine protein phosphatase [Flavobacteriales bacterium]MCB9192383.1 serine/threonine protein phosphatase [Flavobacteriales bacterium]MCB9204471.1 serine/threonine protein phosphatase [Flavobacteriales bacterium]